MNDEQYRGYCLHLLDTFAALMTSEAEVASAGDPLEELAAGFRSIAGGNRLYEEGPGLVARLFASCPQLAPLFPRELLWFLGGDCLHFMPDDELAMYAMLDEMRAQAAADGQILDYQEARAKLLKLQ